MQSSKTSLLGTNPISNLIYELAYIVVSQGVKYSMKHLTDDFLSMISVEKRHTNIVQQKLSGSLTHRLYLSLRILKALDSLDVIF